MTNFLSDGPANASHTFVFAHGAGAGMEHAFMQAVSEQLACKGIRVLRFEFPYMVKRREEGTKTPPNRQAQSIAAYQQALADANISGKLIIGGKSMGGRIASLLASDLEADTQQAFSIAGVICLGFPFYAPKKERSPELSRGTHLYKTKIPTLILQGDRDSFGNQEELQALPLSTSVNCQFIADGDHSFKPRVKSGHTLEGNIETAASSMAEFIHRL